MALKSFNVQVAGLTFLSLVWCFGVAACWMVYGFWMTGALFMGLLVLTVYTQVRLFYRNRKEWTTLLAILRGQEFNQQLGQRFSEAPLRQYTEEANAVIEAFSRLKGKESGEYWILRHTLQALPAGVILTDENLKVRWMNPAAGTLIEKPRLKYLLDHPLFQEHLSDEPEGYEKVIEVDRSGWKRKWWVRWEKVKVSGDVLGLLVFQEIEQILETESIENWKKMIRILTHEITNSLQPMLTLSTFLGQWMDQQSLSEVEDEEARHALNAIEQRTEGLLRFVRSYRDFARFSHPVFRNFQVLELFERLRQLMEPQGELTWHIEGKPGCRLFADLEMLEQALINLVKNSREALHASGVEDPQITLKTYLEKERVMIEVRDNGPGIRPEIAEDIFTPFFTTKPEGSGIGLSVVRQLINLNRGKISLLTEANQGACFRMEFPLA